jgi:IclR family transcriptional regulator, KDG regulon repressor
MVQKENENSLSSTEKALKLLRAFSPQHTEMGTLELSKKLGIHKSTVSRLLHLLAANDFLYQNPETKKYMLGRAIIEMGNVVISSLNTAIVSIAQPHLTGLCNLVGESVALEVLSGTDIVLSGQVEGQSHIRFSFKPGERVPINVAAGAKAILAYCQPDFVSLCLKEKFIRYTANTIVSKKKYLSVLEEVRKTGVAYDHGERYEDSHAIATPIFNHTGAPIAAVVIAGPAFRLTPKYLDEIIQPLQQTAAEISKRLFY